ITAVIVARAARAGDPVASAILANAATAVGAVLASYATLLHPDLIVVDGNLPAYGGDAFFRPLRETLAALTCPGPPGLPDIIGGSDLGPHADHLAAAAIALDRFVFRWHADDHHWTPTCDQAERATSGLDDAAVTRRGGDRALHS